MISPGPRPPGFASEGAARPGVVYLVGGGPGDPGLITVRGAELVATADVILHDELLHPALLEQARPDALVRFVGKRGDDKQQKHAVQLAIEAELVEHARAGRAVVRLKGGDPYLFGRGSEEAEALVRAGIRFEVVPGITSPVGAAEYAGISLTHRDLASSVTFLSGTTRAGKGFDFREIASLTGTVCVLMGMKRIEDVVAGLVGEGRRDPATPAAVIEWGTRAAQRVVEAPLAELAARVREAGLGSPAIIVVGPVAALRSTLRWFDRRPLFGKRVLVARPLEQAHGTARRLRLRGAEALIVPTIALHAPPDPARVTQAIAELASYDLVVFTSENGVERFLGALRASGRDGRAFGAARIAAIGPGTAAALGAFGLVADLVPTTFVGEALAEAVLADPALARPHARVLVPRALVAREVLPEMLRARGLVVDVVPVYATETAPAASRELLRNALESRAIDVALLTSSSTAEGLVELVDGDVARLAAITLASIGPVTTRTAERLGLTVALTASESTVPGLLDALEAHFGAAAEPAA